ncbi:MAG TPA: pyrroline-5-carboxylate reductase dimerization domain-containing protein, partial [Bacteroidales bacterium]|nr:pyrroline-5-carboxylate reductase dimerization domain-containing protein [Bacteroidales bacterium]
KSGLYQAEKIILTRRHAKSLGKFEKTGFTVTTNNNSAVRNCSVVLLCVEPHQAGAVLEAIKRDLTSDHVLISVVSALSISEIYKIVDEEVKVVRAMPNTAISIRESMTCLAANEQSRSALEIAKTIFSEVGKAIIIDEEQMGAATALGACGIAFFLRAIRAASQGGIEIGFHAEQALEIATQTAKGASSLLAENNNHPEQEIDKVTTPLGCTIAGLNRMEHDGFSSAMIKGITTSATKSCGLIDID